MDFISVAIKSVSSKNYISLAIEVEPLNLFQNFYSIAEYFIWKFLEILSISTVSQIRTGG